MNRLAVIALAAVTCLAALSLGQVAHAVTDTVFRYSAVKTGFFGISHLAMAPNSDEAGLNYLINPDGGLIAPTGGGCFNSGVNLPTGATMSQLAAWIASSVGSNPVVTLYRHNVENGARTRIATAVIVDDSNTRKAVKIAIPNQPYAVVANAQYTYGFMVCLGAGDTFFAARIAYTFTHAGD